jgi:hypothetical protein
MEEARLSRGGRRGRAVALVLLAAIIGMGVWARVALWDHLKAAVYDRRIRSGVNPEGNIEALARLAPAAAVPVLERHARDFPWSGIAGRTLYRSFPESSVARGIREYEGLVGHGYFDGLFPSHLRYADFLPYEARDGLRSWLSRHRGHPGEDDACLRLAAELERDEPIEALRLLFRGFHSPDGDKRREISYWFHRVLERFASAGDLIAWLEKDCPYEVHGPVAYVAALKLLRDHRFEEAIPLFERAIPAVEAAGICRDWNECGVWPLPAEDLQRQLDAAHWFAAKARELAAASDPEARAACLHAMGRRAFHDQGIFRNRFHDRTRHGDPGPRDPMPPCSAGGKKSEHAIDDIGLGVSYGQAARLFRRIARECPSYSRIEDVEYSIPLSLWRLREDGAGWWWSSGRLHLDAEIHRLFQAFVARHPRSSMADEALYNAGLSHWEASGRTDTSVLMADMLRIVAEHPGGNIIREHGKTNRWLRAAIARTELSDAVAGAVETVPCLLRRLASAAAAALSGRS